MKLWHDDVRPCPPGWVWAKTNAEAMGYLSSGEVEEISMDHDLGATPKGDDSDIYLKGESKDECGLDLAKWMCAKGHIPSTINIHSWNPDGAEEMLRCFADHKHEARVVPYVAP